MTKDFMNKKASERYLSLIKKSLLNDLYEDLEAILHYILIEIRHGRQPDGETIRRINTMRPDIVQTIRTARDDGSMILWPEADGQSYDPRNLSEQVHTMIGRRRLDHLHHCLDTILADDIPGDLIETGVWRGGATIFMRAHLAAHDITDRTVWVADSFDGLPPPAIQEDIGYDLSKRQQPILAISEDRVRDLFRRYDLLDDAVRFLPGWFKDTLHKAPIGPLALLRLDGDLYESTMDALEALYDKVVPGGFIIIDDYGALPPCRKAVEDFRSERKITQPLERIDWTGMYWRKDGVAAKRPARPPSQPRLQPTSEQTFIRIERPQPAFEDCVFYHTVDLPQGTVHGSWDLRHNVDAYLGGLSFQGKSVLEIGPASGFLSFHMERQGAQVTAIEPTMERLWDFFPLATQDMTGWKEYFQGCITGVRNSFWYLHHQYGSQVRLIEAIPEAIPDDLGDFDIGLLSSVLLHVRSPLSLLESVARRVRDTLIVTDLHDATLPDLPICHLLPRPDIKQIDTWWALSPQFVVNALQCLGFSDCQISFHSQRQDDCDRQVPLFTVVAQRNRGGRQ